MSQVVETIASQLYAMGVLPMQGALLIKMDENTLRVNCGKKNVDITYNYGSDLYDCKVHYTDGRTLKTDTKEYDGMYVEDLPSLFERR